MSRNRIFVLILVATVVTALAACAAVPAPTPTPAPPTATPMPSATPLPTATPTPAFPDPKTAPLEALMYSGEAGLFKTAEFTYTMSLGAKAADEASAEKLGSLLDQLAAALSQMTGEGALEIVDAGARKVNMRMKLGMDVGGQKFAVETILVDGESWARLGEDQPWQKAESSAVAATTGIDPASLVDMVKDATKVEWIEETELNGERVHRLRYTMDPGKMDFSQILQSATGELPEETLQAMLEEMNVDAEVWLRASDLQMRQQRMLVTMTMPLPDDAGLGDVKILMTIDMTMAYSKINEPVVIEAPEE